jgi:hypothetical protein
MPRDDARSWTDRRRQAEKLAASAVLCRLRGDLPSYYAGPAYTVAIDGAIIGVVYRTTRDTSRKVGRIRYQIRESPCWAAETRGGWLAGRFLTQDTRREALTGLVFDWLQSRTEGK